MEAVSELKYKSILNRRETEKAIDLIKTSFPRMLSEKLNLFKLSCPLIILDGTGINDDLNGIERPVKFPVKNQMDSKAVVVQSLAKWKRLQLAELKAEIGEGIITDMRALRPDEDYSSIHSLYVDQWDWEQCIRSQDRTLRYLKETVKSIYAAFKDMELLIHNHAKGIIPILPDEITFVHSEELLQQYPNLTPKQRENKITREYGAVFLIGIGGSLSNGEPHDGRAPDYDDWSSPNEDGYQGLNGDILFWNPMLQSSFELSSMGIRVDAAALNRQLKMKQAEDRKKLLFHQKLLNQEFPESIGGGIGQSRTCMFLLKKAHIGEVQAGIWPSEEIKKCEAAGISLM
jgi:aspartate--ammonia ligase